MTYDECLELVVELACDTQDRTTQEQKALMRVAERVQKSLNHMTRSNTVMWDWNSVWNDEPAPRRALCNLVQMVIESWDPAEGKPTPRRKKTAPALPSEKMSPLAEKANAMCAGCGLALGLDGYLDNYHDHDGGEYHAACCPKCKGDE